MSGKTARIAILGFAADEHVAHIGRALAAHQADAIGVDLSGFPGRTRVTLADDRIEVDGIDLLSFDVIVLRQVGYMWPMPTRPPTPEQWGDSYEAFSKWMSCERESTSLKYSLVSILASLKPVVNPLGAFDYHQMKPLMYASLQAADVPVPSWVAGNDATALALLADGQGVGGGPNAVVKPLAGGTEVLAVPPEVDAERLSKTPLLYQRCVQGRSARAYVVNDRVVAAAEIERGDAVDWRRDTRAVKPLKLEADVEAMLVRAAGAVEMRFAALDFELTDAGLFVLDVNPTPMFAQFERRSGLDVVNPLVDDLIKLALASR